MKKRITAFILTLFVMLGLLPLTLSAAEPGERFIYGMNFERTPMHNQYTSELENVDIGATALFGHSMQIMRAEGITKKSARIAYADWSNWGYNRMDKRFIISADLKFFEGEEHEVYLVLGGGSERTGGNHVVGDAWIIKIKTVDGKPCLYNRAEEMVYTFEYDEVYNLRLDVYRGEGRYDITVNDTKVAENVEHFERVNVLVGTRWTFMHCDVVFDNFEVRGIGRDYPAEYSPQAPGEMPEIDYPEPYVWDGVYRVYHNTVRQDFTAADVVVNEAADEAYLNADKVIPLVKGDAIYTCEAGVYKVADAKTVHDITEYIVEKDGVPMLSLTDINKIFGAKVWLDNAEHMIYLTTGSYRNDNFLRACGYRFVMNGEPYYELSFNKYDFAMNLWNYLEARDASASLDNYFEMGSVTSEALLEIEEKSLKTLQDNGFHTIRVFINHPWGQSIDSIHDPEAQATYFEYMDFLLDLCDKYELRVVMCLMLDIDIFLDYERLEDGSWYNTTGDTVIDMIYDPDSAARKALYRYLDAMIGRYKDRDTVLMWEVSNEMNLDIDLRDVAGGMTVSALQLGEYYADVTEYIHSIDQNHLVDSGDAGLRGSQYNLFAATMRDGEVSWQADTPEEKGKILYIINQGIDVVSSHTGGSEFAHFHEQTMDFIRAFDKPYYIGESTSDVGASGDIAGEDSFVLQKEHLDRLVESGVQLTTWWDYDAPMDDPGVVKQWNVTLETTPDLFYAIADANRALQAKWKVNGWKGTDVTPEAALVITAFEGDAATSGDGGSTGVIIGIAAAVVVLCGAGAVLGLSKKKAKKEQKA